MKEYRDTTAASISPARIPTAEDLAVEYARRYEGDGAAARLRERFAENEAESQRNGTAVANLCLIAAIVTLALIALVRFLN